MRTYRYMVYDDPFAQMGAEDLHEEMEGIKDGYLWAGAIEVLDGDAPHAERAEYLYVAGRLGIAWGAPATWADVDDLESGIELWLNNPDEWESRN